MRANPAVLALLLTASAACSGEAALATGPDPIAPPPPDGLQGCARTSIGVAPLTELAAGPYQDQLRGLYPGGSNSMPAGHLAAGLDLAAPIGPLNADGVPDPDGRYAFISIGMSNTTQEFRAFMDIAGPDPARNPRLVLVDGAQGGQTAADWANPGCRCWNTLDERIRQAGLTDLQVVTAWVKLANRQPSGAWPAATRQLADDSVVVLRHLKERFPNLRLAYLSSRIYAGYATTTLNPEPYAFESGLAVRWVIDEQLSGRLPFEGLGAVAPWVAWGPYLWADGLQPRADGLTWACSELAADGTHPSASGRMKVAQELLAFLHRDPTASVWY